MAFRKKFFWGGGVPTSLVLGWDISLEFSSWVSTDISDVDHVITVSEDEVRRELRRVNIRKAAGPDGITGRVLRSCVDQLAGLFTSIFNESLATSVLPTSFKKSVIIPVPKNSKPSCLNDYRPVALTSTVMKVFERLLKKHICSSSLLPWTLFSLPIAQIGLLMMPSLRYCTPPSHILTAKMATMSDCYSLTIAQLSIL